MQKRCERLVRQAGEDSPEIGVCFIIVALINNDGS